MATLTLKNSTGAEVSIADVGVIIPASGQDTYSDGVTIATLCCSVSLRSLVSAGTLIVNNGSSDLSIAEGAVYLATLWSNVGFDSGPQVGRTRRLTKADGDVTVSSTTFAAVAGMSGTINIAKSAKLLILVNAYGRASALQAIRLSIFVNGSNLAGAGGLSVVEGANAGSLSISGLTDLLSPGAYTVELRARVTGGSGTLFASTASGVLVATVMLIGEDAS